MVFKITYIFISTFSVVYPTHKGLSATAQLCSLLSVCHLGVTIHYLLTFVPS